MRRRQNQTLAAVVVAAIAASVALATPATGSFSDVAPDAWYADAVDWLAAAGLSTGTSPGCYQPDKVLTRAEAAAFLHRLAGEPEPGAPSPFLDVTADWQRTPVAWMAESGITTGIAPGFFAPDRPVTRGQFATFLHRYVGGPTAPAHPFTDVTASWQQAAVAWLATTGITTGTGPTTFSPEQYVTRAQLAVFLHRHAGSPPVAGADTTAVPCTRPLIVHGVGDVNFDPDYGPNPEHPFEYAWSGLGGLFGSDDLTIINLECAPSTLGQPVPKRYSFRCPLESLPPTAAAGIEIANLANNHGADYGLTALLDGNANVAAAGLHPVGVGVDLADANTPVVIERNGTRIAVLGFNRTGTRFTAGPSRPGLGGGTNDDMVAAVQAAQDLADVVIVTIHWGVEGTFSPAEADVTLGHALVDAGADAILGHHPHRLQPLEHYRGKPIFWSLGNFVWQQQARSQDTGVAEITIGADGSIEGRVIPALIADKGHPVLR